MAELEIIVPSRGRPQNAVDLAQVWNHTKRADSRLTFVVDYDDPTAPEYRAAVDLGADVIVGVHSSMVDALNQHAVAVADDCYGIAFMGDDHRPRTSGWDARYVEELHLLGTGMVYGNDLFQGENLPTQIAMTSDIVYTLGWMAPPGFTHLYVDDFWLAFGNELGFIRYLPKVIVEHMHCDAGKSVRDEHYNRVNAPEMYSKDSAELKRLHDSGEFDLAVDKIRAMIA